MPRYRLYHDYFDEEPRTTASLEIPYNDDCTDVFVDLQPGDYVQLRRVENKWIAVTSLPDVSTAQKKSRKPTNK